MEQGAESCREGKRHFPEHYVSTKQGATPGLQTLFVPCLFLSSSIQWWQRPRGSSKKHAPAFPWLQTNGQRVPAPPWRTWYPPQMLYSIFLNHKGMGPTTTTMTLAGRTPPDPCRDLFPSLLLTLHPREQPRRNRGRLGKARLTVQVLDGQDVIPAEDKILAELLVVGRHQGTLDGGVLQPQRVADLVCHHDEEVAPFAAVQGPALGAVKVGFSAQGEEGVSQGTSWGHESHEGPGENLSPKLVGGTCSSGFLKYASGLALWESS